MTFAKKKFMASLKFAPHAPVEEWLATQDVARWREQWLRDGFVVVDELIDAANVVVYRDFCEKLLRCAAGGGQASVARLSPLSLPPPPPPPSPSPSPSPSSLSLSLSLSLGVCARRVTRGARAQRRDRRLRAPP